MAPEANFRGLIKLCRSRFQQGPHFRSLTMVGLGDQESCGYEGRSEWAADLPTSTGLSAYGTLLKSMFITRDKEG